MKKTNMKGLFWKKPYLAAVFLCGISLIFVLFVVPIILSKQHSSEISMQQELNIQPQQKVVVHNKVDKSDVYIVMWFICITLGGGVLAVFQVFMNIDEYLSND